MLLLTMKLAIALTVLLPLVQSMEVYLKEITIFTTHESGIISNKPEVYFICDDDRQAIMLRDVTEANKKYVFNAFQFPAVHLGEKECVVCTLKEYDLFSDDDTFGTMKLCADTFTTGTSEVQRNGEYNIKFECLQCIPKKEKPAVKCPSVSTHSEATAVVKNDKETHVVHMSSASTKECHKESCKKGVSTGILVIATLMGFALGAVAGMISLKFFSNHKREQEANRMRELNAILQQEVPFEELPKPPAVKTTIKLEKMAYTRIPSENLDDKT